MGNAASKTGDEDKKKMSEEDEKRIKETLARVLGVHELYEERYFRQERANKRLTDEKLRLEDDISKMKARHQRQEGVVLRHGEANQRLINENLRQEETIEELTDENLRLRDEISKMQERHQRTKQFEEYCFLYYWMFTDCHVSLETPAGTYISVHLPGTKGFHQNLPNVVQSLKEDIKRLGHPAEMFPLFGLNAEDIDEWYKTIDEHHEQDYSMLETALSKGSNDFVNYLAKYKPSNAKSPHYIYAAAWDYSH